MTKPKLNPPLNTSDLIFESIAAIGMIYMVVQLIMEYPNLGSQIAIHFDASGTVDEWGNKPTILILPIVSIVLYAGLTVLNKYPNIFNYPVKITEENAAKQYQLAKSLIIFLKASMVLIFAYIQHITINIALGNSDGLSAFLIMVVLFVTFTPIVFYLICSYRHK